MTLVIADATSNKPGRTVFGDRRVHFADVTFDSSYPSGGEALTPANFGMAIALDFLLAEPVHVGAVYYNFDYDRAAGKLLARNAATGTEIADTTDLSAVTVRVMAVGK